MSKREEIKEKYDIFVENGDLFELFPEATGNWEEDKESFISYYNEVFLVSTRITEDTESDFDFSDDFGGAF